jgi:hypothetical protein
MKGPIKLPATVPQLNDMSIRIGVLVMAIKKDKAIKTKHKIRVVL